MNINRAGNDILTEKEKKEHFQIISTVDDLEIIYTPSYIHAKIGLATFLLNMILIIVCFFSFKNILPVNIPLGNNSSFTISAGSPIPWLLLLYLIYANSMRYLTLKNLGKTGFKISGGYLSVETSPKKKAGFSGFPVTDIKNMCIETEKNNDLISSALGENTYFIMVETKIGVKVKLWGPASKERNLLFICRTLNNHLDRIKDYP